MCETEVKTNLSNLIKRSLNSTIFPFQVSKPWPIISLLMSAVGTSFIFSSKGTCLKISNLYRSFLKKSKLIRLMRLPSCARGLASLNSSNLIARLYCVKTGESNWRNKGPVQANCQSIRMVIWPSLTKTWFELILVCQRLDRAIIEFSGIIKRWMSRNLL